MDHKSGLLPNTLAIRLFLLASLAALVGIAVVAFVISLEYRRNSEARLDDLLTANVFNLMGNMVVDDDGALMGRPDLGDSRFNLIDSGWYWSVHRIGNKSNRVASISLSGQEISVPTQLQFDETFQRSFQMEDHNGQMLQGLEAQVFLGEGNDLFSFRITANQSVLNEEIASFTRTLAIILSLFAFMIIFVMYWVVRLGLRPISVATQQLAEIRVGEKKQIEGDYPHEIQPLIDETNALISSNELIVERARTQVGNLAHSLKTPLAILQNELSGIPQPKRALFEEQADAMRRQVQFYLDRARIAARSSTSIASTPVVPVITKLCGVIAKLNPDKAVEHQLNALGKKAFAGEEPDLQEILGNLLENAAKYASSRIVVSGTASKQTITLVVEDDGRGMTSEEAGQAARRGGRIDEGKTGWGLGLSIVGDVVDEYAGKIVYGRSNLGGLKVSVTLPAT